MNAPRPGWSWPGAVALVLATTVGIGWAVALVAAVLTADHTGPGTTFLYVLGGTLVGGVLAWLGANRNRDRDRPEGDR